MKQNDITPQEIDKHRAILPLPFEEITYYSSFSQLIGKNPDDYSSEERMRRWKRNMELLLESGNPDAVEHWTDNSECSNCIHLDSVESWCNRFGLPCTFNPILTPSSGYKGMACMGIGRESQTELF